jgi:hypothetical protein
MADKFALIVSLRRYVSLLQLEEKRLKWITTSTKATGVEYIDTAAKLRVVSEKLINAEKELSGLELQSK